MTTLYLAPTCMRARRHQESPVSGLQQVIGILCDPIRFVSLNEAFFVAIHIRMKRIDVSFDQGRREGRANINAIQ